LPWPPSRGTTTLSPSSSPLRDDWGGRDRKDDITAEEWIHDKSTNSDLHKCTIGVVGKVVGTNRLVSAIKNFIGKVDGVDFSNEE
jgi:hypothetical protein